MRWMIKNSFYRDLFTLFRFSINGKMLKRSFLFFFLFLLLSFTKLVAQNDSIWHPGGFRISLYAGIPIGNQFPDYAGKYEIHNLGFVPHFGTEFGFNIRIIENWYFYSGFRIGFNTLVWKYTFDMNEYPQLNAQPISSVDWWGTTIPHMGLHLSLGGYFGNTTKSWFGEIGYSTLIYPGMNMGFGSWVASNDTSLLPNGNSRSVKIMNASLSVRPNLGYFISTMDFAVGRVLHPAKRLKMQLGLQANFSFSPVARGYITTMENTIDARTGSILITGHYIGITCSIFTGHRKKIATPKKQIR
jgi:hypothetical protein